MATPLSPSIPRTAATPSSLDPSTSITTGTGNDIIFTTAQYRKLLVGAQLIYSLMAPQQPSILIFPITDFTTGSAGDILDYGDLLRNATTSYDGSNPFSSGFLSWSKTAAHPALL